MPSAQLLKVAGGVTDRTFRPDATLIRLVQSELQEMLPSLPALAGAKDGAEKAALSARLIEQVVQSMQQQVPVLPGEKLPDYAALIRQASGLLAQNEALQGNNGAVQAVQAVLAALSGTGQFANAALPSENAQGGLISADVLRQVQEEQDRGRAPTKNPQNDLSERALASAARELEKQGQLTLPPESRGREPEPEEITHEAVRNIQKER